MDEKNTPDTEVSENLNLSEEKSPEAQETQALTELSSFEEDSQPMETVIPENLQGELDELKGQIGELMKKYKLTMWLLIASIVVYLVFLFVIRKSWSTYVVLGICVIMIVLAVFNTRYSRQIQKLASRRQEIRKMIEKPAPESAEKAASEKAAQEAIVANASSLNDLPKQYTVLDQVVLDDGRTAEHIVISPYGVALVGEEDLKPEVEAVVQESASDVPVFVYSPDMDIAELAEAIQMEKTIVLDEGQIMDLLFRLTGLKH